MASASAALVGQPVVCAEPFFPAWPRSVRPFFPCKKSSGHCAEFAFFDVLCPSLHPGASEVTVIHGYRLASKTQDRCTGCAGQVTCLMRALEMGS